MRRTEGYTVAEAAKITRVPARSITFWSGPARVFVPEVAHGRRGRGNPKLFSRSDLVRLRVIYWLTQRGIPLATVRALIRRGREPGREHWFNLEYPAAHAVV